MRYIHLAEEEQKTLKEQMRSSSSCREQQRIHCILLSSKKYQMDQLSDIFEVDRDTIGHWFDWWEEEGSSGLKDAPKSGRPKSLTDDESLEVIQLVEENPKQIRKVVSIIKERFGKEVSIDTVKGIIKKRASRGEDAGTH